MDKKLSLMDEVLGLKPMSSFEKKKISVANSLNFLMVSCGFRQKDVSYIQGWKKSQISKILSGEQNLTIKTIHEFSDALGYDFELFFYKKNQRPHIDQPWTTACGEFLEQKIERFELTKIDNSINFYFTLNTKSNSEYSSDFVVDNTALPHHYDEPKFIQGNLLDIAKDKLITHTLLGDLA